MAAPNPRQIQTQQVHYYRKLVNFNDTGIATGVRFGTLPAGSIILGTDVQIATIFNAATTNVVTVGSLATLTEVVNAAAVNEGAVLLTQNILPNAAPYLGVTTADLDLYVAYTQTGAAATTGVAIIVVKYVPNNDL